MKAQSKRGRVFSCKLLLLSLSPGEEINTFNADDNLHHVILLHSPIGNTTNLRGTSHVDWWGVMGDGGDKVRETEKPRWHGGFATRKDFMHFCETAKVKDMSQLADSSDISETIQIFYKNIISDCLDDFW